MNHPALNIGLDRQLFVLNDLIHQSTATVRLHHPVPREIVMEYTAPHEQGGAIYHQILKDGDTYKMYYKGEPPIRTYADTASVLCYAESKDGIHWEKKNLGIVEFNGSKNNNIVLTRKMLFPPDADFLMDYCATLPESKNIPRERWIQELTDAEANYLDTFSICLDPRPDCPPDEKFKALTPLFRGWGMSIHDKVPAKKIAAVLFAFKSPDGIHWERLQDQPVIYPGVFDTMNVSFWDEKRQQFWAFVRDFHGDHEFSNDNIRDVRWCVSKDYRTWTTPIRLDFGEQADIPLYTSAAQIYPRAPQYFLGFPTRYVDRGSWTTSYDYLPDPDMRKDRMHNQAPREGTAITDLAIMASKDGKHWHRFEEAFLRPGPYRLGSWVYGDCYPAWPLVEMPNQEDPSAAPELSFFVPERTRATGKVCLRRFALRLDGFTSLHGSAKPCEVITVPFILCGSTLSINYSTSAAGWLRFELQDSTGVPIPGYTLEECDEVFGDHTDRPVFWNGQADVSSLMGQPVRMRIVLSDADLFSFCFQP